MTRFVFALSVVICTACLGSAQDKAALSVDRIQNLAYNSAKDADPLRHKLDLYVPKKATNFPVVMFVHGGTWRSGNKDLYAAVGNTLGSQGIGTAVINYRLSSKEGKVKHPDHIHDVAKAFSWVKANVGKHGGDAGKLYVGGHSAGGHLVALLGTDASYLKAEGCDVKDIRGVVALSGVYTIVPAIKQIQDAFGSDTKECLAASPMTHVSGHHPPFLIAYGDKDLPMLDIMAEQFGKKLTECKCPTRVMKISDRDHVSIMRNAAGNAEDPLTKAIVEFVKKN